MLYREGNICHGITLVCLQTNRKQPGGKHVRIVKKRLRIFNKIAFVGQSFEWRSKTLQSATARGTWGFTVLRYWVILILTCGMQFFIILADGIR